MELGQVVAAGPPDVVRADPQALAAYLGASDEALLASGPTVNEHRPGSGRRVGDAHVRDRKGDRTMNMSAHTGWMRPPNPLRPLGRSWRRLRRRPRAMQIRTVLIVVAVVVGLVSGWPWRRRGRRGRPKAAGAAVVPVSAATPTPVSQASTSTRGVTAHAINVVFPVVAINSQAGQLGFAEDNEYDEQAYGHPPLREPDQRERRHQRAEDQPDHRAASTRPTRPRCARCASSGPRASPAVFAVLDGIGTWTGDNELCITQEGHTPMIGAWTTVTNWTELGSPYLWWTGADQVPVLKATVNGE